MDLMEIVTCSVVLFLWVSFGPVFISWLLFRLKKNEAITQMDPLILYREETKRLSERSVLINKNHGNCATYLNYGGLE
jgi:hypothetical protein